MTLTPRFILSKLSPADVVTLMNGACGILAILYLLDRTSTGILIAQILILLGIGFDGADGWVARRFGSKHNLGSYLDSLSDFVTFCCAPAFLLYSYYYDYDRGSALMDPFNALVVGTAGLFVIFGTIRLAYYISRGVDLPYFEGIPTNGGALVLLAIFYPLREYSVPVLLVAIVIAVIMVSNIPYPKLSGGKMLILGLLALLLGILGPILDLSGVGGMAIPVIMTLYFIAGMGYLLVGPPYCMRRYPEHLQNVKGSKGNGEDE